MGIVFENIILHNFRNHSMLTISKPKTTTIIIGSNAVGKSNIIEAVQLVTMLQSFRSPQWQQLTTPEKNKTSVLAEFVQNGRQFEIRMDIEKNRRYYWLNGKKKTPSDIQGLVPAVVFVPDDLMIVKDSSEVRRKLTDDLGRQLSTSYSNILIEYKRIVKQRNNILKAYNGAQTDKALKQSWDSHLVTLGATLLSHRIRLFQKIVDKAAQHYLTLCQDEQLTSAYIPSFQRLGIDYTIKELIQMDKKQLEDLLCASLKDATNEEYARGKTLVGPHRDEIQFFIDGYNARQFSSQGQQRSIALALKLAELEIIEEISDNQPILLLDDVFSELDECRRVALINAIKGQQTIITATDLSCFDASLLVDALIIDLNQPDNNVYKGIIE